MLPIMPVLPVLPAHKHCIVNNLGFDPYHGMEEVVGSIPTRSTNKTLKISILISYTPAGYRPLLAPIGANFAFFRAARRCFFGRRFAAIMRVVFAAMLGLPPCLASLLIRRDR
jgi:hypothetical protein